MRTMFEKRWNKVKIAQFNVAVFDERATREYINLISVAATSIEVSLSLFSLFIRCQNSCVVFHCINWIDVHRKFRDVDLKTDLNLQYVHVWKYIVQADSRHTNDGYTEYERVAENGKPWNESE